jgi:hypothetical protein
MPHRTQSRIHPMCNEALRHAADAFGDRRRLVISAFPRVFNEAMIQRK